MFACLLVFPRLPPCHVTQWLQQEHNSRNSAGVYGNVCGPAVEKNAVSVFGFLHCSCLRVVLLMVRTEQRRCGTQWSKWRCCGPERTFEGSFEAPALMLTLMLLVALMTTDSKRSDSSCVPTTTPPSPTHLHSHTCTHVHSHTITHTLMAQTYDYYFIIYFVQGSPTLVVWFWLISEKLQLEATT